MTKNGFATYFSNRLLEAELLGEKPSFWHKFKGCHLFSAFSKIAMYVGIESDVSI